MNKSLKITLLHLLICLSVAGLGYLWSLVSGPEMYSSTISIFALSFGVYAFLKVHFNSND